MKVRDEIWKVMGLDPGMVLQCTPNLQRKYTRSGAVLAFLFLASLLSGAYAFYIVTDYVLPAVPFGMVWAWMILNLYRLTLVTVGNKFMLPASKVRFPFISLVVRLIFLSMLAFFISKPLEILIHSAAITPQLEVVKETILEENKGQEKWLGGNIGHAAQGQVGYYADRVLSSGYLIKRLEILHAQVPGTWWFTACFMMIFAAPFWIRVRLSKRSEYEKIRATVETDLIMGDYERFKAEFAHRLSPFGAIEWEERYKDAPFNTEPGKEKHDYNRKGSLKSWMIEP